MVSHPKQPEETKEEIAPFIIGIDLGTTNCAMSYVRHDEPSQEIRPFAITQWTALGEYDQRETLPSFAYQATGAESDSHTNQLPWGNRKSDWQVGVVARDHGSRTPNRQIVSAKSWLCHSGVDRVSDLLPWQSGSDIARISPVEASSLYLRHLREAWDHQNPDAAMAEQDIVITIPASFDEIARELTVEAAKNAGLRRVTLIEEPQSAFYAWLHRHREDWSSIVQPGDIILVCDIGGGTTDFTLIQAREDKAETGGVRFHRLSVGDHLILGGDNLDLTLAQHVELKLGSNKLSGSDWDRLIRQCRTAKEKVLGDNPPETITINLPGKGSRLLGGSKQVQLSGEEISQLLIEGFFPIVEADAIPIKEAAGLTEFGLPYAEDPAITKHLAQFLTRHANDLVGSSDDHSHSSIRPDVLLFNGGMFESPKVKDRLVEQLEHWFRDSTEPTWSLRTLESDRLDLAVAHGASVFGMARQGVGIRISAGLARSYYVGISGDQDHAVCLLPAGIEPGESTRLDETRFCLRVGTPIQFPIYSSSTRTNDGPGEVIEVDPEQLKGLPPIRTVIETRKNDESIEKEVELLAELTEVGTMNLSCHELDGEGKWKLQFDVRSATQTDVSTAHTTGESHGLVDESTWATCEALLAEAFGDKKSNPDSLVAKLSEILEESRNKWRPTLLRRLWEGLLTVADKRSLSSRHEARWLNMVGFFLRPGYGMAMDDWRVATTWKTVQGKLFHSTARCRAESWILWRRVAGGLTAGQQQTLASPLLTSIRQAHKQVTTGRGKGTQFEYGSHEAAEVWRMLGSLEKLPTRQKIELGDMILDLINKKRFLPSRDGMIWALARLGARRPIYGLLNDVLPADVVERWLRNLIREGTGSGIEKLAAMQLARRCDDRYRDIDDDVRSDVLAWMKAHEAAEHLVELVERGGVLDTEEQERILGDALPIGLSLQSSF